MLRIGNASGFYGDRFAAFEEMLRGGELDVLTGDYLAELTMLILARDRARDPATGYAKTFLRQLETCLGTVLERNVTLVVNAGGLNPAGLAEHVRDLAERLGIDVRVAHVEGDDVTARSDVLGGAAPLAANAYLGAFGIAECVTSGADVIVTGRVTDASLTVGPAVAHFGWGRGDLDQLAGAVVAGHAIECGAHVTGGNFSFFTEIPNLLRPGFPLVELHADGSCIVTKHPGTGGAVTVETVTAQLLYEIHGARYVGPDVTARLDTLTLEQEGEDRVRISGVRGELPPPTTKVSVNGLDGFRNEMEFVLGGLDIDAQADLVQAQLEAALDPMPAELRWTLARTDHPNAATQETASARLRVEARDPDKQLVGRAFSSAAVELALSSYPGAHLSSPPGDASPVGSFSARYIDNAQVDHIAVLADGTRVAIDPPPSTAPVEELSAPALPPALEVGPTVRAPLGTIVGARSGDKGGDATLGVWARSDDGWRWLSHTLTVDLLRELLPETAGLTITRTVLPNLRSLLFVIEGILGDGVASHARFDPQAKGMGEWLRSRIVDMPQHLHQAANAP